MAELTPNDVLLLDLLNSTPLEGEEIVDALGDDAGAAAWTLEHGGTGTLREVGLVREVREALQGVVRGDTGPQSLAPFITDVSQVPTITSGILEWQLQAPDDSLLAARAVIAWSELEQTRPGRLRSCGNPDCRLFLVDRSHGNRAQWCSMAVCGNRMKARRHYDRKREATAVTPAP
jgi:predicted RNA-binding Zn ribbon-like protein